MAERCDLLPQNPFDAEDSFFISRLDINAILSVITTKERIDGLHQVCHEEVEEVIVCATPLAIDGVRGPCTGKKTDKTCGTDERRAGLGTHCDVKQETGHCDRRHACRLDYEQNTEASRKA